MADGWAKTRTLRHRSVRRCTSERRRPTMRRRSGRMPKKAKKPAYAGFFSLSVSCGRMRAGTSTSFLPPCGGRPNPAYQPSPLTLATRTQAAEEAHLQIKLLPLQRPWNGGPEGLACTRLVLQEAADRLALPLVSTRLFLDAWATDIIPASNRKYSLRCVRRLRAGEKTGIRPLNPFWSTLWQTRQCAAKAGGVFDAKNDRVLGDQRRE